MQNYSRGHVNLLSHYIFKIFCPSMNYVTLEANTQELKQKICCGYETERENIKGLEMDENLVLYGFSSCNWHNHVTGTPHSPYMQDNENFTSFNYAVSIPDVLIWED
jgi:hypothetical protein